MRRDELPSLSSSFRWPIDDASTTTARSTSVRSDRFNKLPKSNLKRNEFSESRRTNVHDASIHRAQERTLLLGSRRTPRRSQPSANTSCTGSQPLRTLLETRGAASQHRVSINSCRQPVGRGWASASAVRRRVEPGQGRRDGSCRS